MKYDEQLLKEINPVFLTARSSIRGFAYLGDETAKEIIDFLDRNQPDAMLFDTPAERVDSVRMVFMSILEARYRVMEEILKKEEPGLLLDIPCGYTMRPVTFARKGSQYVGADLPATISDMAAAVDHILTAEEKKYVRMVSADATNAASIEAALKGLTGEVCITTEGLLSYFTDSEIDAIFDAMMTVLAKHGGCWLTPDREFDHYMKIAIRVVANGDQEMLKRFYHHREEIGRRAKSNIGTNAFMISTIDESIRWANQKGFHVERINVGRFLPDLKCFEGLRDGLMDELRDACMDLCVWKMTPAAVKKEENNSAAFEIATKTEGDTLVMKVTGRLDTLTAPELVTRFGEAEKVRIDFSDLAYISSAGLRSLLIIMKKVGRENMSIVNLNENVRDIFETTGFADIML